MMSRRGYLDLTPIELLGRQYIVWGLGLVTMPPLLTSCHTGHYLCQAHWNDGVSPFISLLAVFPWMLSIAIVMLGGLGMSILGGILFLTGRHLPDDDPIQVVAFRACVGSLLSILLIGGFGYFVYDAIWRGFYYSPDASVKNAWIVPQALSIIVYLTGAVIASNTARRAFSTIPSALSFLTDYGEFSHAGHRARGLLPSLPGQTEPR